MAFTVPTTMAMRRLKKFLGYLKNTMGYCLVVELSQAGEGYVKKGERYWCLETLETKATESQHQEDSMC